MCMWVYEEIDEKLRSIYKIPLLRFNSFLNPLQFYRFSSMLMMKEDPKRIE